MEPLAYLLGLRPRWTLRCFVTIFVSIERMLASLAPARL